MRVINGLRLIRMKQIGVVVLNNYKMRQKSVSFNWVCHGYNMQALNAMAIFRELNLSWNIDTTLDTTTQAVTDPKKILAGRMRYYKSLLYIAQRQLISGSLWYSRWRYSGVRIIWWDKRPNTVKNVWFSLKNRFMY